MGGLIGAILRQLFESILDKGVESAGERASVRYVRLFTWILSILLAAWIAVASALLWADERVPDAHGLVSFVQRGGDAWVLALPVVAALLVIWLLLPLAGRHSLSAALGFATFALTLGALVDFYGSGTVTIDLPTLFSFFASLLLVVGTLVLMVGDNAPLDSPRARLSLVYWGRLKHLGALREYGREHGYAVTGPGAPGSTLKVEGRYDAEHAVVITSSWRFTVSTSASATYTLSAKMTSPRDIVAFRISYQRPAKNVANRVVLCATRGANGTDGRARPLYFYVVPDRAYPIPGGFTERMAQLAEAGRPFLTANDFARATPFGLRYTHRSSSFGLSVRDAQMDPVLAWMRELVALLEPISPGAVAAQQPEGERLTSRP